MSKAPRIVSVVQARMGSTRLPGKALLEIASKPMLWHVINRLAACRLIAETVIAIPEGEKDDKLERFGRDNGIRIIRGSENDVLDRYYKAAVESDADIVVRITSDCPLIDPVVTDSIIAAYLNDVQGLDGANNVMDRTYPRGLDTEVISAEALKKAWKLAEDKGDREHVTAYLYKHRDLFRLESVKNKEDLSALRWTVDEKADLEFVRQIYDRLYHNGRIFLMEDILKALKDDYTISAINKNVKQKAG